MININLARAIVVAILSTSFLSIPASASGSHEGGHEKKKTSNHMDKADMKMDHDDSVTTPAHKLNGNGSVKLTRRLVLPKMDPVRGKKLFVSKGCVACHSINGIGGHDAPKLDAHTMDKTMNPFDFTAKMWRAAPAMIAVQEEAFGEQVYFTGDELADIAAFVHSDDIQQTFKESDLTPEARKMMDHSH